MNEAFPETAAADCARLDGGFPAGWMRIEPRLRNCVQESLLHDEQVVAWLQPDLNSDLQFAAGLLVLTNMRLISAEAPGSGGAGVACRTWRLSDDMTLETTEDIATGTLLLTDRSGRLSNWRCTAPRFVAARQFVAGFDALRRRPAAQGEAGSAEPRSSGAETGDRSAADAPPKSAPHLLRLVEFARPWKWLILLGGALSLAGTAAGLVPPYLTMPLLDKVLIPYQNGDPSPMHLVPWFLAGLAGAALLSWGLSWGRTYVMARVSERVAARLRRRTYSHLQRLSLEYFGGRRTGDLISRVSSDSDRICYFLSVHLIDFASSLLLMTMTAIILFSIDPLLAIVTLIPLPLIAWLVQSVRNRLRRRFRLGSRAWANMTSVLADTIPGIRVVKAFAQEQREIDRFSEANTGVVHANDRVNRMWSFFSPLVVLLTDFGLLVVWAFGIWGVFNQRITVGVLTAFVAYISRFYSNLDSMSRMTAAVQRASASAQRLFDIMDKVPSVSEPADPVRLAGIRGEVALRNVAFRYGNREVLHDVNLDVEPGEMIGLVGASGSGKTTLVNLVCRFYDVTEGRILVDGVDIRRLPIADYRRNIGLVLQEPFLFYGTIAENIAYGRPDASRAEIIEAARAAHAHHFILRLPDGYDSLAGERGQFLSGGERQRISIARALLIDPRILILDEATSSVDTETEREIQLAIDNLTRGRTTIAIAHRLSTLAQADRLIVLERGCIVETGTHEELLRIDGPYSRLHRAQFEADASRGSETRELAGHEHLAGIRRLSDPEP